VHHRAAVSGDGLAGHEAGIVAGEEKHHVGHIGILGVDKKGEEWYQISLGGSSENEATLGDILGPSVPKAEVAATLERILRVYLAQREGDERFIDTLRRIGLEPFRAGAYRATPHSEAEERRHAAHH
jgi:sulfite reductase (NADPH) hemoprotein beta-component